MNQTKTLLVIALACAALIACGETDQDDPTNNSSDQTSNNSTNAQQLDTSCANVCAHIDALCGEFPGFDCNAACEAQLDQAARACTLESSTCDQTSTCSTEPSPNNSSFNNTSLNNSTFNSAPGNGAPGNGTPGNGAPGNNTQGNNAQSNSTPGNGTPGNSAPDNSTAGNNTSTGFYGSCPVIQEISSLSDEIAITRQVASGRQIVYLEADIASRGVDAVKLGLLLGNASDTFPPGTYTISSDGSIPGICEVPGDCVTVAVVDGEQRYLTYALSGAVVLESTVGTLKGSIKIDRLSLSNLSNLSSGDIQCAQDHTVDVSFEQAIEQR